MKGREEGSRYFHSVLTDVIPTTPVDCVNKPVALVAG
jgi:hypothetical protein